MKFMLQITVNQPPTSDWTETGWDYEKDIVITDALRSVAHIVGSRLDPLEPNTHARIFGRDGSLIGEWRVVDE